MTKLSRITLNLCVTIVAAVLAVGSVQAQDDEREKRDKQATILNNIGVT